MTIKCWSYDAVTGELMGQQQAMLDPVEGKPLVPAYATLTPPPQVPSGMVAAWNQQTAEWVLLEDYRGMVYDTASGQPEQWDQLGPLPNGKTNIAPPDDLSKWDTQSQNWAPDLAKHKASRIAQLTTAYEAAVLAGVNYQGAIFDSDDHSQTELARVLVALSNGWTLPTDFAWIDRDNQPHPVPDAAWLQGLAKVMADHKASLFGRLQAGKAAVRAATTVAEVEAITF